ncbi:hypothetical protein [Desulfobacula sp.]|uniref:hypothetical protein n=1 Tax=Desulfobacula sp. TaxID=2593537 RepID=UPI002622839B|nr:hypothetical protein [Desulfobacula sp.]
MIDHLRFDRTVWTKKAMAFVTRSHRHLWGKNNEDPQAFLFTRGFSHQFAKTHLFGWNKFGQERPLQNWGNKTDSRETQKLFLPPGIVIPFIVEKKLQSIFIHPYDENKKSSTTLVPGSWHPTMVLGGKKQRIAVIQNIFDGLFLFQEMKDSCCVMIHPDPDIPLARPLASMVNSADSVFIFSSGKKELATNKTVFPDLPNPCFYLYQSKEEAKEIYLTH